MTEVTAKYKLFLAVGMVVTGTLNTISTKERFQFHARNFHLLKMGKGSLGNITFKLETNLFTWNIKNYQFLECFRNEFPNWNVSKLIELKPS